MTKGEQTRAAVLEAAARVIGREGILSLTIRAVAKEANVSPSLVSKYHPDFQGIVCQLVAYIYNKIISRATAAIDGKDAKEKLLIVANENFQMLAIDEPDMQKVMCLSYLYIDQEREIRELHHFIKSRAIRRGMKVFKQLAKEYGFIFTSAELKRHSTQFFQALEGGLLFAFHLRSKMEREEYKRSYLSNLNRSLEELIRFKRTQ